MGPVQNFRMERTAPSPPLSVSSSDASPRASSDSLSRASARLDSARRRIARAADVIGALERTYGVPAPSRPPRRRPVPLSPLGDVPRTSPAGETPAMLSRPRKGASGRRRFDLTPDSSPGGRLSFGDVGGGAGEDGPGGWEASPPRSPSPSQSQSPSPMPVAAARSARAMLLRERERCRELAVARAAAAHEADESRRECAEHRREAARLRDEAAEARAAQKRAASELGRERERHAASLAVSERLRDELAAVREEAQEAQRRYDAAKRRPRPPPRETPPTAAEIAAAVAEAAPGAAELCDMRAELYELRLLRGSWDRERAALRAEAASAGATARAATHEIARLRQLLRVATGRAPVCHGTARRAPCAVFS